MVPNTGRCEEVDPGLQRTLHGETNHPQTSYVLDLPKDIKTHNQIVGVCDEVVERERIAVATVVGVFVPVVVGELEGIVVATVVELLTLVGVEELVLEPVHFVGSVGYSVATAVGVFVPVGAVGFVAEVALLVSSNLQATIAVPDVPFAEVDVVLVIGVGVCASSAVLGPIAASVHGTFVVDKAAVLVVAANVPSCLGGSFVGKNSGARHTHRVHDRDWVFVNIVPTGVARAIEALVR